MRIILIVVFAVLLVVTAKANCISGNCSNGRGIYKYDSQDKYIGDFSHGLPNGFGIWMSVSGEVKRGYWRDGVLTKEMSESEYIKQLPQELEDKQEKDFWAILVSSITFLGVVLALIADFLGVRSYFIERYRKDNSDYV